MISNEHQAKTLDGIGNQIADLIKKWLQNENKYVDGDQSFCFLQQNNNENHRKRKADDNIHLENIERKPKKQKKNSKSQTNNNDISHTNPNAKPYVPKRDSAGFKFFFVLFFCDFAHTLFVVLEKKK